MAEPEKNIQEIQAVIKAVSGHPEVNIDQAAEIMALTNEKLELARSLQSLQDFSAIEIERARQYIQSIKLSPSSDIDNFETILRVLDFQKDLITLAKADETIIKERLSSIGINYHEPNRIKLWHAISALGYVPGRFNQVVQEPITAVLEESYRSYFGTTGYNILKPTAMILAKGWFGRQKLIAQNAINLGFIDYDNIKWDLKVYGHENVIECGEIARHLQDHFRVVIDIELDTEEVCSGPRIKIVK